MKDSDLFGPEEPCAIAARVEAINPADLTRQINTIQMKLLDLAQDKTETLAAARPLDLEAIQPSIHRIGTNQVAHAPTRSQFCDASRLASTGSRRRPKNHPVQVRCIWRHFLLLCTFGSSLMTCPRAA